MTSRVFDLIHSKTLALEGGGKVTNNPSDRGGLTKYGISQKAFPNEDIANLTLERARQLAYDTYWVPIKLDQVTVIRVAEEMFDTGYNMGPVTAVKIAQESINYLDKTQIEEDGKVGPQTLSRINYWSHFDPETFVKVLNGFQFMRYVKIREEDPSQVANARGWMKRIQDYHDSDKW